MERLSPDAALPASTLAMALIISSQAPLILLDGELRIVAASASFYQTFKIGRPNPGSDKFSELGAGEWNVPQLIALLRVTAAGSPAIEAYEMDLVRAGEPTCHLVISAHKLEFEGERGEVRIVLAATDVTAARLADKLKDELLHEKAVLMQELQHRVANSLQIIASVLMQSARRVNSEETRSHLHDAHHRVLSIATLQKQLATTQQGEVELRSYFKQLCDSIAASMVADPGLLSLTATVDDSKVDARISASLGLIVTELVINSLKHAFPNRRAGKIKVNYHSTAASWSLSVDDDGIGFPADVTAAQPGLGTGIVEALAKQLDARVVIANTHPGTTVSVTHG